MTSFTFKQMMPLFLATVMGMAHAAEPATARQIDSLYVGFYKEDPVDNPEDPTLGTLYLKLPTGGGAFAGNMFFTYLGCQRSNVGTITGKKEDASLRGVWTGTTDGTSQHGEFAGTRVPGHDDYEGTYSVAGGKQHIVVDGCIQYYVASKGTFELLAAGRSEPTSFVISLRDKWVSWTPPNGAVMTLIAVIDPDLAGGGGSTATLWQTLVAGDQHTASLGSVKLIGGHRYLASVAAVDQSFKRISFGSREFVAQ